MLDILLNVPERIMDAIGIIIAAVVPVIIMFTTMRCEKKRYEKSLQEERERHLESLSLEREKLTVEKTHHLDTQRLQQEEIIVSKMPYLCLSTESRGGYKAVLMVENCGNGSAFEVQPKTTGGASIIHEGRRFTGKPSINLILKDYMYESTISVGKTGHFEVGTIGYDEDGNEISPPRPTCTDKITITLCFKDSLLNAYEQVFEATLDASCSHFNIIRQGFPQLVTHHDAAVEDV